MKRMKVGIWGWWQGKNLGDNWIKKTIQKQLSAYPFFKLEFIDTDVKEFNEYDFIIIGGGGLFIYDVISPWKNIEKIDVPFGVIGLGAEFEHSSNVAQKLVEKSEFFYVRDNYSVKCMSLNDYNRSYDTTFLEPLNWKKESEINIDKCFFVWRDGKELSKNDKFKSYIGSIGNRESYKKIIIENFKSCIEHDFYTEECYIDKLMLDSGFIISGRYHGIIAAIQMGIPFVAIDVCPKIRALVHECCLDDYCIKYNEINKLNDLIVRAKKNYVSIRERELKYRKKAISKISVDWKIAIANIIKTGKPLKAIHFGSYWMKENDIVNVMGDDLQRLIECEKIDCGIYEEKPSKYVKKIEKKPNTVITILKDDEIRKLVEEKKPDFIIMNSGGLTFEDCTFKWLKEKNIILVGIELSDPDVYPYNGKLYSKKFDFFYTNSRYSLKNQYDKSEVNIKLLPFAASTLHHYYMPEIKRKYDIVIVGHARKDRIDTVNKIKDICEVGTYGSGWPNTLGVVNGREHVRAINTGKMYLSFSKTVAGYDNVKVGIFEAIACKQVVITSYMSELEDYFTINKEILCYKNDDELMKIILYYLKHEDELERIRNAAYDRFIREHTYVRRWQTLIGDIYKGE